MSSMLHIARADRRGGGAFDRIPEPAMLMEDQEQVRAFHKLGQAPDGLAAVYRWNAILLGRLIPRGGTLLDLGSGSGQFLFVLAARRPDIRIVGVELSEAMLELGRRRAGDLGFTNRLELRRGDMRDFAASIPETIHVISSLYALHHLRSTADLRQCLRDMQRIRLRDGSAVWIYDHARPRHEVTAEHLPGIWTPDAPEVFRNDSAASMKAAFTGDELAGILDAELPGLQHRVSRLLPVFQAHWTDGAEAPQPGPAPSLAGTRTPVGRSRATRQPLTIHLENHLAQASLHLLFGAVPPARPTEALVPAWRLPRHPWRWAAASAAAILVAAALSRWPASDSAGQTELAFTPPPASPALAAPAGDPAPVHLAVTGAFAWGRSARVQVNGATGRVTIQNGMVTTGPAAACRLECDDGSLLTLGGESHLRFTADPGSNGRILEHVSGQTVFLASKQKQSLLIRSGELDVRILGTQLVLESSPRRQVRVLEGLVAAAHLDMQATVGGGQAAWVDRVQLPTGPRQYIVVEPDRDSPSDTLPFPDDGSGVDFNRQGVINGHWRITRGTRGVAVSSGSPLGQADIELGRADRTGGAFSFRVRIEARGDRDPEVGALFFGPRRQHHSFVSRRGLKVLLAGDPTATICMRYEFGFTQGPGRPVVTRWEVWSENAPEKRLVGTDWSLAQPMAFDGVCGVGFSANHCTAEFTDIRLE